MFFASMGLLIGASLGLGYLLGRASNWSSPSAMVSTSVAPTGRLPAAGAAKTKPQTEGWIPPGKVNERTLTTAADLSSNAPGSEAGSPNVGGKKTRAESSGIAKSQPLVADTGRLAGVIQQPVTLEAKEPAPVTILNATSDPTVDAPSRDAQHWLKLAEDARHQAKESTRPGGKRLLLRIADTYERLAQLAAEETGEEKPRRHRSRR
jgi:hypothetical protein